MKYNLEMKTKVLDNGATVILIHKADYVKSLFMVGIPAGGFNVKEKLKDEILLNPTGAAHFLEHQMFRLDGEDVTERFAQMAAQPNAFTSYTETVYYFTTNANPIEPLKLLLNFVQTLDITEESVNKEKGIILSEYNIYDQNPEQKLLKDTFNCLYKNHPLHHEILGTREDIENMTVEQLSAFYNRNYDSSRLIILGVTGQDLDPIMDAIIEEEKKFKSQVEGIAQRIFEKEDEKPAKKHSERKMDISKPYICLGYKFKPYKGIQKNLKVDLAVSLWLDSLFGYLNPEYQKWIDEHIISTMAGAEADFNEDHAYALFYAQTDKMDDFEKIVRDIIENKRFIEPEAFEALKIQTIARNLRNLDNFESLAVDLIRSKFEGYDFFEEMDLIRSLSIAEVNQIVSDLSFDQEAVVKILPESASESETL